MSFSLINLAPAFKILPKDDENDICHCPIMENCAGQNCEGIDDCMRRGSELSATCFNYKPLNAPGPHTGTCSIRACDSVEDNVYGPEPTNVTYGKDFEIYVPNNEAGITEASESLYLHFGKLFNLLMFLDLVPN